LRRGIKAGGADENYWHKFAKLKAAADRFVVTPNNVSIGAYGEANLAVEPVVISVPAWREDRWYIVQLGDKFDEIVRNIGGAVGARTGPVLPRRARLPGPTPATTENGSLPHPAHDRRAARVRRRRGLPRGARAAQSGFHMLAYSVFRRHGLRYEILAQTPSSTSFTATGRDGLQILEELGFGMQTYLSVTEDHASPLVASFAVIGPSASNGFQWRALDDASIRGRERAVDAAEAIVDDAYENSAEAINGWRWTMADGHGGHDFALRAVLAKYVLGGDVPEEIVYANCRVDEHGEPLAGANAYTLRFPAGQTQPATVLWNLAMYDPDKFFVDNDIDRYTIGSTTDQLTHNADGSLTIFIQRERPDGSGGGQLATRPRRRVQSDHALLRSATLRSRRRLPTPSRQAKLTSPQFSTNARELTSQRRAPIGIESDSGRAVSVTAAARNVITHGASGPLVVVILIVCEHVLVSEHPACPFGTTSFAVVTTR
jgi:hypothetical protein